MTPAITLPELRSLPPNRKASKVADDLEARAMADQLRHEQFAAEANRILERFDAETCLVKAEERHAAKIESDFEIALERELEMAA